MAVTHNQTQITWAAANSKSVASGATDTSDAVLFNTATTAATISVKANHSATPASGDIITAKILFTNGDTDAEADVTDEYDSLEHASVAFLLDTNAETNPIQKTVEIPASAKGYKLSCKNDGVAAITVSSQMTDIRA